MFAEFLRSRDDTSPGPGTQSEKCFVSRGQTVITHWSALAAANRRGRGRVRATSLSIHRVKQHGQLQPAEVKVKQEEGCLQQVALATIIKLYTPHIVLIVSFRQTNKTNKNLTGNL